MVVAAWVAALKTARLFLTPWADWWKVVCVGGVRRQHGVTSVACLSIDHCNAHTPVVWVMGDAAVAGLEAEETTVLLRKVHVQTAGCS